MIHYQLEFDDYLQHLIRVTLRIVAAPQQQLWLPTWIPGSYLIREFAKHIEQVRAFDETGRALKIDKISKNRWQLYNTDYELISIEYLVYAYDLSVRGSYVDQLRLYVNPAAVCLAVAHQEQQAHELELFIPPSLHHFDYAGALKAKSLVQGRQTLKAHSYQHLIDSPFELAEQQRFEFDVNGIPHQWVISGQHDANLNRIKTDLTKICQTEIALFGSAPFLDYTFLTIATGQLYGGLEHQASTSLICPRDDLPNNDEPLQPSASYQRYLGLCSHEYFHAWLVKAIRPHNYLDLDLNQEGYTSLLWLFEGVTSYYDDLILARAGVISQQDYLKLLTENINRYLQNPGRHHQSLSESSFDAWIKFYRPDENTGNAGISYYNKGALAALCLDAFLHQANSSLDAVLRELYQRAQHGQGVSNTTLAEICTALTDQNWQTLLSHLIDSTEDLPLAEALAIFGIDYQSNTDTKLPFGAKVQEKPEGLNVQSVLRDSTAAAGGLSAHDVIVALNGIKATSAMWQKHAQSSIDTIQCHVFRRDELRVLQLKPQDYVQHSVRLTLNAEAAPNTRQWLGTSPHV